MCLRQYLGNHKFLNPDLSGGCPYIGSIPVGIGFPNPLGEETSPLQLGTYQRMTDGPHTNVNTP